MRRKKKKNRGAGILTFLLLMVAVLAAMAVFLLRGMNDVLEDTESAAEAAEEGTAVTEAAPVTEEEEEDPQEASAGKTDTAGDGQEETGDSGENSAAEPSGTDGSAAPGTSGSGKRRADDIYEKPNALRPAADAEENGYRVAIDPGHQEHGNSEREPIGPGASETKAKVASGTHGRASGLDEYELNLIVALQLRDELKARGYDVYMIRETHDVDISNKERAIAAAESGSDILVRIHANGSDNTSIEGTLNYQPGESNPYLERDVIEDSRLLSKLMLESFVRETGAKNLGLLTGDDMSGINWSTIPVTIVEMGFMSNAEEDLKMASPEYQEKMVKGMADGIDAYFRAVEERDS